MTEPEVYSAAEYHHKLIDHVKWYDEATQRAMHAAAEYHYGDKAEIPADAPAEG